MVDLGPGLRESLDDLRLHADRMLAGRYDMLGVEFEETQLDWFLDPASGRRAPDNAYGPSLDYRNVSVFGDVKNVWEKSRHTHLARLALAASITQDPRYADLVERQLMDWVEKNPFPRGINWASALEAGMRLLAWVWIERLLRGTEPHRRLFDQRSPLWSSIYWHQWFCWNFKAPKSSANNHLLGEMAGLLAASTAWPVFESSRSWREGAADMLRRAAHEQFFPGGLNREQAFEYHLYSTELLIAADAEHRAGGGARSASLAPIISRAVRVIESLIDTGGNLPRYGDADDARGIALGPPNEDRIAVLRDYLDLLHADPKEMNRPARTLTGACLAALVERQGLPSPGPTTTLDAGLHVLVSAPETSDEVFVTFDAGPQGFSSLAAHGHADALSFTASYGGHAFLVDPGTYTYFHEDPRWRRYFKSTAAHNTVELGRTDQAVAAGDFLWSSHADATLVSIAEDGGITGPLSAEHRGYTRLEGSPIHRRTLELRGNSLVCIDEIRGTAPCDVRVSLHFAPDIDVDLHGSTARAKSGRSRLALDLPTNVEWKIQRAASTAGWYSPRFHQLEESVSLVGSRRLRLPARLETHMEFSRED